MGNESKLRGNINVNVESENPNKNELQAHDWPVNGALYISTIDESKSKLNNP